MGNTSVSSPSKTGNIIQPEEDITPIDQRNSNFSDQNSDITAINDGLQNTSNWINQTTQNTVIDVSAPQGANLNINMSTNSNQQNLQQTKSNKNTQNNNSTSNNQSGTNNQNSSSSTQQQQQSQTTQQNH